ncbi:molybdopterin cofactor-binding domain-containing protein [Robiginitalea sp. SC105]|uniref:xanthine dehydrogenase family protein molybdopterin-binding subunit n=1 Tax=Robiginitalea sp. SC105 TaxID=2762332 RepID=UPI001639648E|nr:molybdopterin cofactor-binding domain-containing protein [Robiginitalea sp. SC105]MBC2840252.1 xanthine dehydrogenase family protein molybdopterin-binding subunit [Robiginitalea sp. SC105]
MAEKTKGITRRKFVVRTLLGGTGLIIGTTYLLRNPLRRKFNAFIDTGDVPYIGETDEPALWFEVTPENGIILSSPKVEMGQGIFTGLAQIAAGELDVDVQQIRVIHAPTASGNVDDFGTGGSTTIRSLWPVLRSLSATLREMLKAEAARKLGLPVSELTTEAGRVWAGDRSLSYGEIVEGVQDWASPDTPPLREVGSYPFIGRPVPRNDLADKVFGAAIFGMDATLPDMLYGAVARPSHIGARLKSADTSRAASMAGVVRICREADFVGVVATSRMAAENAKNAIEVDWDADTGWQTRDIEEMIRVGNGTPYVIQKQGNAERAFETAPGEIIRAEFKTPIGAHAQLEPNGALAWVEEDQATVILSTQVPGYTQEQVARRLDLKKEQVNLIPTFLGGGFGRRLNTSHAVEAAVMSRAVGKPVKCYFNRQEEFQNDEFRPPSHMVVHAKLSDKGGISAFEFNTSSGAVMHSFGPLPGMMRNLVGSDFGAWRGGLIQYGLIPDFKSVSWFVELPFATATWRGLGLLTNTFAIESFLDELARKAGRDPVGFRLMHIRDDAAGERLKNVIRAAAEKAGYRDEVVGGTAMGLAASTDAGSPAAHVAEVSIRDGEIRVEKVTCAFDPGLVINPDLVRAQCEGNIIMGMSAALYEEMHVEDGELLPVIYGPYRMAQMKDGPREIEVVLLQGDDAPGAVGEPPMGPIAAAIANAVTRLTGKRPRQLPIRLS